MNHYDFHSFDWASYNLILVYFSIKNKVMSQNLKKQDLRIALIYCTTHRIYVHLH
jgi:hypothetical protein